MEHKMKHNLLESAYFDAVDKVVRNSNTIGLSFPHVANGSDGSYNCEPCHFWTSGFWGGLLWLAYRETGQSRLFELACDIEESLDKPLNEFVSLHHDVGFMWLPTSVCHYRLTGSHKSRIRSHKAASLLAGRFNLNGRYLRAWNEDVRENSQGLAIIDCMMNLPLLYWAGKDINDPRFSQIAAAHADTVLKYFVREDNTVPHIMEFDAVSGNCLGAVDGQGKSPDSVWSRGQAWAIYGFAISYRETGTARYLEAAQKIACQFYHALPQDKIPLWDFSSDPEDSNVKDSSAACIAASGMLEISALCKSEIQKNQYYEMAVNLLECITISCAKFDESSQGIIDLGTVSYFHHKHINQPIIYGDFYYLEALGKLRGLQGFF